MTTPVDEGGVPSKRPALRRVRHPSREGIPEAASGPLPKLLYSVEDVAAIFGRSRDTIRDLCFAGAFPYRLETRYWGRLRRTRRMCFSMIDIQAALDYFAPPVERVMERASPTRRLTEVPENNGLSGSCTAPEGTARPGQRR